MKSREPCARALQHLPVRPPPAQVIVQCFARCFDHDDDVARIVGKQNLGRMGFVTSQKLRVYRRHVFVGILVLAMLLTPPDPITQLQMAIPLYLLYECCIGILCLFERREQKRGNEE